MGNLIVEKKILYIDLFEEQKLKINQFKELLSCFELRLRMKLTFDVLICLSGPLT